jgi:hypothetical protein
MKRTLHLAHAVSPEVFADSDRLTEEIAFSARLAMRLFAATASDARVQWHTLKLRVVDDGPLGVRLMWTILAEDTEVE